MLQMTRKNGFDVKGLLRAALKLGEALRISRDPLDGLAGRLPIPVKEANVVLDPEIIERMACGFR